MTFSQSSGNAEGSPTLSGLRVLDMSRVLAGPYCCQMLGDHGADVIKIESPHGDDTRGFAPPHVPSGASAYYAGVNRNKRNLCLDLSTDTGQSVLRKLISSADVLVENFKPRTLDRWGFGYEALSKEYPGLVYCRITGYGDHGPLGGRPGYDAILQAYGGLMSVNGETDGGPLRVGVPIVDLVTGIHAFAGVLLALQARAVTGRGQLVDCALLDTAVSLLHPQSASWLADGKVPPRTGSAHPTIAPYDRFETAAGPFFISAANDRQFRSLIDVLGAPELALDERFATNSARVTHVADLKAELTRLVQRWDPVSLAEKLLEVGVPATPVNDVSQALSSEQVAYRDMVVEIGDYRGVGVPIKLSETSGRVEVPPPPLGQDTRAVLAEAGIKDVEIERLLKLRVAFECQDPAATQVAPME